MTLDMTFERRLELSNKEASNIMADMLNSLYAWLADSNRYDDMRRAFDDDKLREKLMSEYKGICE